MVAVAICTDSYYTGFYNLPVVLAKSGQSVESQTLVGFMTKPGLHLIENNGSNPK